MNAPKYTEFTKFHATLPTMTSEKDHNGSRIMKSLLDEGNPFSDLGATQRMELSCPKSLKTCYSKRNRRATYQRIATFQGSTNSLARKCGQKQ
ncbi:hypothetical protein Ciccas_001452 [Cichlidogyrus casuarinus]|uniref:Uncharacterized protein n=1 Tax=Cichlidogyrus casuarinus TaxID=1844966 RepID=A0ABD2QK55_9PLAT